MNTSQRSIATAGVVPINAYRLVTLHRRYDGKEYRNSALLYRDGKTTDVEWTSKTLPDTRLKPGAIVSPRFCRTPIIAGGSMEISRLVLLERPEAAINLFDMVPESWVSDHGLIERASSLWNELPYYFQVMFNTIFWCGERFKRYCIGQSSIRNHHACTNGNFEHSVEVAEIMLSLLHLYPDGNRGVAIMAGLLHDAGKADEYYERGGDIVLSRRGCLLGHKVTIVEWIAVAREKVRVGIPDSSYISLIHALTATGSVAAYTGLRDAKTPEAKLLTHADRISGNAQLTSCEAQPSTDSASVQKRGGVISMNGKQKHSKQRLHGMEELLRSIQSPISKVSA